MRIPSDQTVTIDGKQYKLSKFTTPLFMEFNKWAQEQLPNPLKGLWEVIKDFPLELQKQVLDNAEKKAALRGSIHDPDIKDLLATEAGHKKILCLLFRKYHPALTEEQVMEIAEQGYAELGETWFEGCFPEKPGESGTK